MSEHDYYPNGRASIREVHGLLNEVSDRFQEQLDRKFSHLEDQMNVRFIAHEQSHKSLRNEAVSRYRWLVGCVLGLGTLLATVVGFVYR